MHKKTLAWFLNPGPLSLPSLFSSPPPRARHPVAPSLSYLSLDSGQAGNPVLEPVYCLFCRRMGPQNAALLKNTH